jgi:tRNA isopentenyl-2-thiomethyl-A-37 hydroxylase MiaE
MPSPAIAHFSKADLWHCEQMSRQHGDQVYRTLMASQARHYGIYWVLANIYCDLVAVTTRLENLVVTESEILTTLHPEPRIYS